jgi:hypothetical protein
VSKFVSGSRHLRGWTGRTLRIGHAITGHRLAFPGVPRCGDTLCAGRALQERLDEPGAARSGERQIGPRDPFRHGSDAACGECRHRDKDERTTATNSLESCRGHGDHPRGWRHRAPPQVVCLQPGAPAPNCPRHRAPPSMAGCGDREIRRPILASAPRSTRATIPRAAIFAYNYVCKKRHLTRHLDCTSYDAPAAG